MRLDAWSAPWSSGLACRDARAGACALCIVTVPHKQGWQATVQVVGVRIDSHGGVTREVSRSQAVGKALMGLMGAVVKAGEAIVLQASVVGDP